MRTVIGSELEEVVPKSKNNWLWIVLGVFIVFVIIIGYFVIKDFEQEKVLKEEIASYFEKNLSEDEYVLDVKTTGDYAIVERTIKTYLMELSNLVKEINLTLDDETLLNILSADNYRNDGPDFLVSLQKIEQVRNKVSQNIEKIVGMLNEEYLLSLINEYALDSYYIDFYKEVLYQGKKDLQELEDAKLEYIKIKDNFLLFLSDCENVLKFLKENRGLWTTDGDTVVFESTNLLEKYTELTDKLVLDSAFLS